MLGRLQGVSVAKATNTAALSAKTLQMQCTQLVATDAFVKQEASLMTEAVLFC